MAGAGRKRQSRRVRGLPAPEEAEASGAAAVAALAARVAELRADLAAEEEILMQKRDEVKKGKEMAEAVEEFKAGFKASCLKAKELKDAERQLALQRARLRPDWRDWAGGLPEEVLAKIATTHVAQTEAGWAAQQKERGWVEERSEENIQREMAKRERDSPSRGLFVFAMVCKPWRKAQLRVGGKLRTRVPSDVMGPGRVALAKWALAGRCPRHNGNEEDLTTMADVAARYGHLELVQWLCGERSRLNYLKRATGGFDMNWNVMANAAMSGNLELVEWLRGKGCEWDSMACESAALGGHLGVLQWLRANGCDWDAGTGNKAAYGGHLATLRWARENGCGWSALTCAFAAFGGQLEVLQWLRANGCPWTAQTCDDAARGGHLETLRWARENGCGWGEVTTASAAWGGHLGILQWLRAEGCPWDEHTCYYAVDKGHVEMLSWARENGCWWDAQTRDKAAAEFGYADDFGNLGALDDEWFDDEFSDEE